MALIENLPIKEVYNKIANHFDRTRQRVWGSVREFMDRLPYGSSVLDAGCGNGKNMLYRAGLDICGVDVSEEQIRICLKKNLNVKLGSITQLDYADCAFDSIICIATYHHLSSTSTRSAALNEMYRVLRPGGTVLLTVWAQEQGPDSSFHFTQSDEMVPWTSKDDGNTYLRYYHIYSCGELEAEIRLLCPAFHVERVGWELGNWYAVVRRL